MASINSEEIKHCVAILRKVIQEPGVAEENEELRDVVIKLAKRLKKQKKSKRQEERAAHKKYAQSQTIRIQSEPEKLGEEQLPLAFHPVEVLGPSESFTPIRCYVCKQYFHQLHFRYHMLCPSCAELNEEKRGQRIDLAGYTALVTGGRIKIGFEVALKMLRDGANVIVTTRFPKDAAKRYAMEADFADWSERLVVMGLDLRSYEQVNHFLRNIHQQVEQLDIIVNNAAQTIKRPIDFFHHLIQAESDIELLPQAKGVLHPQVLEPAKGGFYLEAKQSLFLPARDESLFPSTAIDYEGNPVDKREKTSWNSRLEEVSFYELVEAHMINSFAPFLLIQQLKPLMTKSCNEKRIIVNVSSNEGQFSRDTKTVHHPHLNMAKSGINMITRTSADDLIHDGIYMNSVDIGWVTEGNPYTKKKNMRQTGFVPPLDVIDGASRVYDPVVRILEGEELVGLFLKNYKSYGW